MENASKIHIAYAGSTPEYLLSSGFEISVFSLLRKCKSPVTIHVLSTELSNDLKTAFHFFSNNFPNASFEFHKVDPTVFSHIQLTNELTKRISFGAYFRILIPKLCNAERVLYLDTDTLIVGNISRLFKLKDDGAALCSAIDKRPSPDIDWTRFNEQTYYNTGVLLFNNKNFDSEYLNEFIEGISTIETDTADQDIFNTLYTGAKVKYFSTRYNTFPGHLNFIERLTFRPLILHFFGPDKPWGEYFQARVNPWIKGICYSYFCDLTHNTYLHRAMRLYNKYMKMLKRMRKTYVSKIQSGIFSD